MRPNRVHIILVFSLCLAFIGSGCDIIYPLLQKEGAEEKALLGEIIPHTENLQVVKLQELLALSGYNPGRIDGVMGLNTRNAIESFQKDHGIEPSRFLSKETWQKLNRFEKSGLVVEGTLNVPILQKVLKQSGFDPGPVDGRLGPRTQFAVKSFQKEMGLKVDGKVGSKTLAKLHEIVSQPSYQQKDFVILNGSLEPK